MITGIMSRRRNTTKLYANGQRDSKPMPAEGDSVGSPEAAPEPAPPTENRAAVSADTLDRMLAAEAAEREVSEQRTSDLVGRYFKLTLAMVCANMIVAGANVAMLLRHPAETRTIVTVPAPAPTPAPAVAAAPALPEPAPTPAAVPSPVAPAQPVPLLGSPAKTPLLGAPGAKTPLLGKAAPVRRAPRAERAPIVGKPFDVAAPSAAPEPVRAVGSARPGSVLTARLVDERSPSDPPLAERW